ncbi:MAG TPA: cupredoxin domain-containing protein [Sphingomonas sp.]|jgi:plastocyanin|nr:cupredoxin domain-containing protein [Sphingomonas sp.]
MLHLALIAAAAAAPPDWGTAREVEVRLSSFAFTPPRIELNRGEAVRLELVNDLHATRSFHAPRFFAVADMPSADRSKVRDGSVRLRPGQRTTVRLVAPPSPGTYRLRSGRILQAALGMTGAIVVR